MRTLLAEVEASLRETEKKIKLLAGELHARELEKAELMVAAEEALRTLNTPGAILGPAKEDLTSALRFVRWSETHPQDANHAE